MLCLLEDRIRSLVALLFVCDIRPFGLYASYILCRSFTLPLKSLSNIANHPKSLHNAGLAARMGVRTRLLTAAINACDLHAVRLHCYEY